MDLEAEYNNGGKVPEAPEILAGWQRRSAAFRGAHPHAELDVAYGASPRQALDVFWPAADRAAPLAIWVHGGYWRMGERTWNSHLAQGLLAHGVAVAMPSYDLCPHVPLSTVVDQVRDAAAFLFRRHGRPMLAAGHSAGGHLASMLLCADWAARGLPQVVAAALPVSGLFDLPPLTRTTNNVALRLDEAEARRLSPALMPRPPGRLHAIVGGTEGHEYTRQTSSLAEAWGGTWEALAGANHFTVVAPLADPGSAMVRTALGLVPRA